MGILSKSECARLAKSLLALQNLEHDLYLLLARIYWNEKQSTVAVSKSKNNTPFYPVYKGRVFNKRKSPSVELSSPEKKERQ